MKYTVTSLYLPDSPNHISLREVHLPRPGRPNRLDLTTDEERYSGLAAGLANGSLNNSLYADLIKESRISNLTNMQILEHLNSHLTEEETKLQYNSQLPLDDQISQIEDFEPIFEDQSLILKIVYLRRVKWWSIKSICSKLGLTPEFINNSF